MSYVADEAVRDVRVDLLLERGTLFFCIAGPGGYSVADSQHDTMWFGGREATREWYRDTWRRWRIIARAYSDAAALGVEVQLQTDGSDFLIDCTLPSFDAAAVA